MVEITLESLELDALPKDLFLSLRVGAEQKFNKAATARSYKFAPSAVGDRRCAKLEIYQRVGTCTMSIDIDKVKGVREISVPIE